jgi:hypothetical protein
MSTRRITRKNTAPLLLLACALALAACTKDKALYPSLSIREGERVSGTFTPVAAPAIVSPPPSAEVRGELARLRGEAAASDQRFLAAADNARGPVEAARGAEPGSDAWSAAQVALGDVAIRHSETMVVLAELDRIQIAANLEAGELDAVEAAQGEVAALVRAEDERMNALSGVLAQ